MYLVHKIYNQSQPFYRGTMTRPLFSPKSTPFWPCG